MPLPTIACSFDRRCLPATCLAIALLTPLIAGGQGTQASRANPPVTWCEKPGSSHAWQRQPVYFTLDFVERDSSAAQHALRPYLPFLLSGIAHEFMVARQPARNPAVESRQAPPDGEPRYGPRDLVNPDIEFDLRGDGVVEAISATDTLGSLLVTDLTSAISSAITRGDVFGPYVAPGVRTRLRLSAQIDWPWHTVHWPAFTINAPIEKPPLAKAGNRGPNYPSNARDWEGTLLFQYKVDADGRAVRGTARVLRSEPMTWSPDATDPSWNGIPSAGSDEVYAAFKREVELALPGMRFLPAEYLGCRVEEWVQQSFVFTLRR